METGIVTLSPNVFVYKINDSIFIRADENVYELQDIKNINDTVLFIEQLEKGLYFDKYVEYISGEEKDNFLKLLNFLNDKGLLVKSNVEINSDYLSYKKYYSDSDVLSQKIESLKKVTINIICENDKFKKHLFGCLGSNGFDLLDEKTKGKQQLSIFAKDNSTGENELEEFNKLCFKNKTPWLLVDLSIGNYISVGPLIIPGKTACYNCYLERRIINSDILTIHSLSPRQVIKNGNVNYLPFQYDFIASIILDSIIRFFLQLPPLTQSCVIYADLQKFDIWKEMLLKYPKCPVCQ